MAKPLPNTAAKRQATTKKPVRKPKPGYPLSKLIANTPNKTTVEAKEVQILKESFGVSSMGKPTAVFTVESRNPTTKQRPPRFKPQIRLTPGTKDDVWVHCQCEAFIFRCEYALAHHGAASIIGGNGEPAIVTNPRNIPYLCKHLYRMARSSSLMSGLKKVAKSG